jgi:hypothetical protein
MMYSPPFSRMFGVLLLTVIIGGLGLPVLAAAPDAVDVYSADVGLADNSQATRQAAFRQALAMTLIKLSGTREILEASAAEKILDNAQRYVRAYNTGRAAESAVNRPAPGSANTLMLHVDFDGSALERALIDAGLPVWSGVRPATLVWLAVEDSRRYVLADNSNSPVLSLLQQAAMARGLPLIAPLMDQTDRKQVEYIDIQGEFTSRLQQAAERYNVPVLLIGSLRSTGNSRWNVKWTVMREDADASSSWTEADLPLEQALQSGVDGLADILSSRYAFVSSPGGQLSEYILSVDKVSTLQHYAQVLDLLQKLVFVESVTPVRIEGAQVNYQVRMRGSLQELRRALGLRKELEALETLPLITAIELNNPAQNEAANQSRRDKIDLYFALNPQ